MVPNKEERMFVIECGNDGASTVVAKAQSRKKSVRAFVIECENDGSSTIVVGSPETKNEENEEDENDENEEITLNAIRQQMKELIEKQENNIKTIHELEQAVNNHGRKSTKSTLTGSESMQERLHHFVEDADFLVVKDAPPTLAGACFSLLVPVMLIILGINKWEEFNQPNVLFPSTTYFTPSSRKAYPTSFRCVPRGMDIGSFEGGGSMEDIVRGSACDAMDKSCTTASDCCDAPGWKCDPFGKCKRGGYQIKGSLFGPCKIDEDCQTNKCDPNKLVCVQSEHCQASGESCEYDKACCSGVCDTNAFQCADPSSLTCGKPGMKCRNKNDCCGKDSNCILAGSTNIKQCWPPKDGKFEFGKPAEKSDAGQKGGNGNGGASKTPQKNKEGGRRRLSESSQNFTLSSMTESSECMVQWTVSDRCASKIWAVDGEVVSCANGELPKTGSGSMLMDVGGGNDTICLPLCSDEDSSLLLFGYNNLATKFIIINELRWANGRGLEALGLPEKNSTVSKFSSKCKIPYDPDEGNCFGWPHPVQSDETMASVFAVGANELFPAATSSKVTGAKYEISRFNLTYVSPTWPGKKVLVMTEGFSQIVHYGSVASSISYSSESSWGTDFPETGYFIEIKSSPMHHHLVSIYQNPVLAILGAIGGYFSLLMALFGYFKKFSLKAGLKWGVHCCLTKTGTHVGTEYKVKRQ
jgi:hypothetical protein